jgi:hypothetical protein
MTFKAGDWVEVRSKEEVLRSLDKHGRLDGLPFMPQMFQYCGRKFKVYKRAHKTCDTAYPVRGRRLADGIHLDLRCDGKAYGGCQAACLIFWKEAWLKPVGAAEQSTVAEPLSIGKSANANGCTEQDVLRATRVQDGGDEVRYSCQATLLPYYTTKLAWWDPRQYVEDYASGNVTLRQMLRGFVYSSYYHLTLSWRNRIGRPARWFYSWLQSLWGGIPYPRSTGAIPVDEPAPTCNLNLQPGELVRVKSHKEILATLNIYNVNRGLLFDAEQVPYCGGQYRVKARISTFIDEKTGRLKTLKTPAVMLEGVWCQSRYSNCRMFCPRSIYPWWREIWLERVTESAPEAAAATAMATQV